MLRAVFLTGCISVLGLSLADSSVPSSLTPQQAQQMAQGQQSKVIVIMRDQLPNSPPLRSTMASRIAAVAAAQAPMASQLLHARSRPFHSFGLINAFATSVSAKEAAYLASHPLVQAVVPDMTIRAIRRSKAPASSTGVSQAVSPSDSTSDNGLCGTLEPEALQLTNAAFLDSSIPQAQQVRDGNGQTVTGRGVKVAYIADGLDPKNPGFIRPDGQSVFFDYQNFSGDPAGTPTAGGEAFGDASSIAAQDDPNGKLLTFDISKFVNPAHPLPTPCNIHIRGMAPGASLAGLDVFSSLGFTTTSTFVQAIEWAVVHDNVDVINESFGGNPFPDQDNDPISLADHAAVRAGVTVVVSTGDAGSNGTLGSPSTDPFVISAGASTQFRLYAQTGYGAQALANGYLSNNISSLSSGGFAQLGARTVDVVAPGDLGWALCSTNTTLFADCTDFKGAPTPVQAFGGTSEASPLTAGEAALVIQAYRSTHRGTSPSPALIKQIIMSTATDLGAPADEQGAGLINALAAVNAALSLDDGYGSPQGRGDSFVSNPTSSDVRAEPNTHQTLAFQITNTGAQERHLAASLVKLGAPIAGATLDVTLNPATDPTFLNPTGAPRSYVKRTFHVPANAQHLDAAIAWKNAFNDPNTPIVYIGLLDPSGRQAAYSIPQGLGSGYGHVDIVSPAAGTWTALIWTRPSGTGSYTGGVHFTWAAERYVSFGSLSPSHLDLAPGASAWVTAQFAMPSEPGDSSAAIHFTRLNDDSGTAPSQIPISLRTLIPVNGSGANFSGTVSGGNGRPAAGPTQTFEFDVPSGQKNMSLAFDLGDKGDLLEGLLVDPNGMQLSVQPNFDANGNLGQVLQLFREYPQSGRWKFVLLLNFSYAGNATSVPFNAQIRFNTADIFASGLPNNPNTKISASGGGLTAKISVKNGSALTTDYFVDARLQAVGVLGLATQPCSVSSTLPGFCSAYFLPTQVSSIQFTAQSTAPINMDAFNDVGYNVGFTGAPDLWATQVTANTVVASLTEPEIPYGLWIVEPSLVGPYGASGAPTKPITTSAFALMQLFDTTVSSTNGDLWQDITLGTNTFKPLVLSPGASGSIKVTIKPDASLIGQTISGYLYIDTFNATVQTGDEVVRLPYTYTVTK